MEQLDGDLCRYTNTVTSLESKNTVGKVILENHCTTG